MPLAFVTAFTLFQEAHPSDDFPTVVFLWLILFTGWMARGFQSWRRTRKLPLRALVLPLCAAIVMFLAQTNAAPTILFQKEKPALRRALSRVADKDGVVADLSPIGALIPTTIYKEGKATCFWFWEEQDGFLGDVYESGFAYCPGDAGCQRAGFQQDESPESHDSAEENLGGDWYRVRRWSHH